MAQSRLAKLEERIVRVQSRSTPAKVRQEDLDALAEGLDAHINRDPEAKALYVSKLLPALKQLLDDVPTQFSKGLEHQHRLTALQILSKLALPQQPDGATEAISECCIDVLRDDNQENATLACTVIWQLMRLRRHQAMNHQGAPPQAGFSMEDFAVKLLKLLLQRLGALDAMYEANFTSPDAAALESTDLLTSSKSFKIVSEMLQPSMMALQMIPQLGQKLANDLLGGVLAGLALKHPQAAPPGMAAASFLSLHEDFSVAKIKLVTLLFSMLRFFIKPLQANVAQAEAIVSGVIHLMLNCPVSVSNHRDLLYHARQLFTHPVFAPLIPNKLTDLIAGGALVKRQQVATHELLAYTVVTEVTINVRKSLTPEAMEQIVDIFTGELLNTALPLAVQLRCMDLMVKCQEELTAHIRKAASTQEPDPRVRRLLGRILMCMLTKLGQLAVSVPKLIGAFESEAKNPVAPACIGSRSEWVQELDVIESSAGTRGSETEREINDARTMCTRLLLCLHHTFIAMHTTSQAAGSHARCFTPLELRQVSKTFANSLSVLALSRAGSNASHPNSLYEAMAHVLSCLLPVDFADIFFHHFDKWFDALLKDDGLMTTFQHLLKQRQDSSSSSHWPVAHNMLRFLLEHEMDALENLSSKRGKVVMNLYRLIFGKLMDPVNENQLKSLVPVLSDLLSAAMACIRTKRHPHGYLTVIRLICKMVHGNFSANGPLIDSLIASDKLSQLLSLLLGILQGPNCSKELTEAVVELCLMLPARLSDMLTFLPKLMRPLLLAIKSNNADLMGMAFKVLEVWVDSLNPQFLEPNMQEVVHELMPALWDSMTRGAGGHAGPFGTKVVMLLGKLGGRNHAFVNGPIDLQYKKNHEHGLRLILTFEPSTSFLVPLDRCIQLLVTGDDGGGPPPNLHHRRKALQFLHYCLASILNMDGHGDDAGGDAQALERLSDVLLRAGGRAEDHRAGASATGKTKMQHQAEDNILQVLLTAVLSAPVDEELRDIAEPFVEGVCRHIALLFASGLAKSRQEQGIPGSWSAAPPPQIPRGKRNISELDVHVAFSALVAVLTDKDEKKTAVAVAAIDAFVATLLQAGAAVKARRDALAEIKREAPDDAGGSQRSGGGSGDAEPADRGLLGSPGGSSPGSAQMDVDGDAPADGALRKSGLSNVVSASDVAKAERDPEAKPDVAAAAGGARERAKGDDAGRAGGDREREQRREEARSKQHAPARPRLPPSTTAGLPPILDDLMGHVLHACHGDTWGSKIGGVAAMGLLMKRLPAAYLRPWAPQILAALASCMQDLPEHASCEVATLSKTTLALFRKCVLTPEALPAADAGGRPAGSDPGTLPASLPAPPARVTLDLENDHDLVSLIDQLAVCLLNRNSSKPMRDAALESLALVCDASGLTPAEILRDRWETSPNKVRSHALFTNTPTSSGQKKQLWVKQAVSTVQSATAFMRVTPSLMKPDDAKIFDHLIRETLLVMKEDDSVLLQMAVGSRSFSLMQNPLQQLRVACVQFLSALLLQPAWADAADNHEAKFKIVGHLVRLLTSHSLPLALQAYDVLKHVLPGLMSDAANEATLREALKPTIELISPADPADNAAVERSAQAMNDLKFLDGLGRTLDLLAPLFPDSVGETLVQCLSGWMSPRDMVQSQNGIVRLPAAWTQGDETRVPAAILSLFCKLQPSSKQLLQTLKAPDGSVKRHGLVVLTIELEQVMERSIGGFFTPTKLWSPLRLPLTQFLACHPQEAIAYFLNLQDQRLFSPEYDYFWLLYDLVRVPSGAALLDELCGSVHYIAAMLDKLLEAATAELEPSAQRPAVCPDYYYLVLHLLALIVELRPRWLAAHPELYGKLVALWRAPGRVWRLRNAVSLSVEERHESMLLAKCLLAYVQERHDEVDMLFELLTALASPLYCDASLLTNFCHAGLHASFSPSERTAVVKRFLDGMARGAWPPDTLLALLKHLMTPLVENASRRGELDEVLTDDLLHELIRHLGALESAEPSAEATVASPRDVATPHRLYEDYRVACQVLRLMGLLIELVPARLRVHRKALLGLCWPGLRRNEVPVKDLALLTISKFFRNVMTVEKEVPERLKGLIGQLLHIYVTLLRASSSEHDAKIVREALDVLTPCLPVYIVHTDSASAPGWVNYVRKVVMEDGGMGALSSASSSNHYSHSLAHVWGLVVRHADQFYPHMPHLMQQMINSLTRLAQPGTANTSSAVHQAEQFWPVVHDMVLCISYWIRCLQAGRPLVAPPLDRSKPGEKRNAPSDSERQDGKRIKLEDGSAAPGEGAAGAGTSASGALDDGDVVMAPPEGERTRSLAPTDRRAPVTPGSPESKALLDAVKIHSNFQDVVQSMSLRMALWTDRVGRPKGAAQPVTAITSVKDSASCAKIWRRSMQVLKSIHSLLPDTHIKLGSYTQKLFVEQNQLANADRVGSSDSQELISVVATVLHVATFAHGSTAFLNEACSILKTQLQQIFKCTQVPVIEDFCSFVRTVFKMYPIGRGSGIVHVDEFKNEVLQKLQAFLGAVSGDSLSPILDATRTRPFVPSSLMVLHALVEVHSSLESAPLLRNLVMLLPRILGRISKGLLQSNVAQHDSSVAASAANDLQTHGSVLQSFQLCLRSISMPQLSDLIQAACVQPSGSRVSWAFAAPLQALCLCPVNLPLFGEVLQLVEAWMSTRSGPVLKQDDAMSFLRTLSGYAARSRSSPLGSGTPMWLPAFQDLIYKICVNADNQFSEEFSRQVYRLECEYLVGLSARSPELRAKFLKLYDSCIKRTLNERLTFIIKDQKWEHSANTFWLKRALDLLLTLLKANEHITLAPNSAQVVSLIPSDQRHVLSTRENLLRARSDSTSISRAALGSGGSQNPLPLGGDAVADASGSLESAAASPPAADGHAERLATLPPATVAMLQSHVAFLQKLSRVRVTDLVHALMECAESDDRIAYHLWVLVFPIVWATLEKDEQLHMAKPIINLISRVSSHMQPPASSSAAERTLNRNQASRSPNVIQALMESINLSQPQPKIPPELIKFLAKNHSAWHIAIPLLENHVIIFPDETRCFHALSELYRLVGEQDIMYGLWKQRCFGKNAARGAAPPRAQDFDVKLGNALSLVQLGKWQEASTMLKDLNAFYKEQYSEAKLLPSRIPPDHSHGKAVLVLEEWINCMKQLNKWEELYTVAQATRNPALKVDCEWRLGAWDALAQSLKDPYLEDCPSNSIVRAYHSIVASNLIDGESTRRLEDHLKKIVSGCLSDWSALPPHCINPQINLLQQFQQLVEVLESAKLKNELQRSCVNGLQAPDAPYTTMKETCETWRLRTANTYDSLLHWGTLIRWRNHIYDHIIKSFMSHESTNAQLYSLGYKDKSWSVNTLARVARKHGLPQLCNDIINKMYGYPTMEVSEAFTKIQEQCRAFLEAPNQEVLGLHLVNNTNLEYFKTEHHADIFKLKGLLHQALEEVENAFKFFFTSVHIKPDEPNTWLCWGNLCSEKYDKLVAHAASYAKSQNEGQSAQTAGVLNKAHTYLENAIVCYMTSIRHQASYGLFILPRVLCMVSFHTEHKPVHDIVKEEFTKQAFPLHVFLPFVHHIMEGLLRPERLLMHALLRQLLNAYPQAVYYLMRTSLLQMRDIATRLLSEVQAAHRLKVEAGGPAAAGPPPDMRGTPELKAFELGKELMDFVRSRHSTLTFSIEQFVMELGTKFAPRPEERLLSVVYSLLMRCYKIPLALDAKVPAALKTELGVVCKACFSPEMTRSMVKRGVSGEIRESFVRDLDPIKSASLGQLTQALKTWRNKLQEVCQAKFLPVTRLEDDCPTLASMQYCDLELPGQHQQLKEYSPEHLVYLERVASDVVVLRRHCVTLRRLQLICSDGRSRYFTVQSSQTHSLHTTDERIVAVHRSINRLLDKHPESRRRHLRVHTPIILSAWPQSRLVQEEASNVTYGEAYEVSCARYGRETDKPIIYFKDKIYGGQNDTGPEDRARRLRAFREILEKPIVSENVFGQYMYKSLPSCNHLFVFKKQFCAQYALASLLTYIFCVPNRAPNRIIFAKASGRITQQEFAPAYNMKGVTMQGGTLRPQEMPYRFTRNLHTFFSPFGVEGWFLTSMVLAAQAMLRLHSNLRWVLMLFFRDDLANHQSRLRPKARPEEHALLSQLMPQAVTVTVEDMLARIRDVSSTRSPALNDLAECSTARQLIETATDSAKLCMQDPTWHPWF